MRWLCQYNCQHRTLAPDARCRRRFQPLYTAPARVEAPLANNRRLPNRLGAAPVDLIVSATRADVPRCAV
jgi:hypothetical protein